VIGPERCWAGRRILRTAAKAGGLGLTVGAALVLLSLLATLVHPIDVTVGEVRVTAGRIPLQAFARAGLRIPEGYRQFDMGPIGAMYTYRLGGVVYHVGWRKSPRPAPGAWLVAPRRLRHRSDSNLRRLRFPRLPEDRRAALRPRTFATRLAVGSTVDLSPAGFWRRRPRRNLSIRQLG
jgi:hypothetical protein